MDKLDEKFATGVLDDRVLSAPLQHAVLIGKRTMNKYYELSNSSDIYRMSMGTSSCFAELLSHMNVLLVLYPSYKTTYFERLKWSKSWIDKALRITREAWKHFKPSHIDMDQSGRSNPSVSNCFNQRSLCLIYVLGSFHLKIHKFFFSTYYNTSEHGST